MPGNTDMLFDNFFRELLYQKKSKYEFKNKKGALAPQKYSPYGIRTRVTAVKRRCLNPLTNGPYKMGTSGIEPPTSRLSGVRSNHLSYAPKPL